MSRNLFVYGTLQDPDVRGLILNSTENKTYPAVWDDIQLYEVEGEKFPFPKYQEGKKTPGLIIYDIDDEQWQNLMNFEDEYKADVISFTLDTNELAIALVFLPKDEIVASDKEWTLTDWEKTKPTYIEQTKKYLDSGQW